MNRLFVSIALALALSTGALAQQTTSSPSGVTQLTGDCTAGPGVGSQTATCLKTNGVAFGTAATVNTGTSGATIPLLNGANTVSGAQTNSTAGAASTPAMLYTGAPYTAGTATTNYPLLYFNGGTAPTTWNAAGTYLGFNCVSGYTGNVIDTHLNGGISVFKVDCAGAITSTSSILLGGALTFGATQFISANGRGILTSPNAGQWQFGNTDAASPVAQTVKFQNVAAGNTNNAGANTIIQGSLSNGSGVGGTITVKTSASVASSGVQNGALTTGFYDTTQHFIAGNTASNPPTCGTGCASIAAGSSDQRMTVTTGTTVTAITVNFGKTWDETPVCVVSDNSTVALGSISAISATAVTVTTAAALTAAPVYLLCQ